MSPETDPFTIAGGSGNSREEVRRLVFAAASRPDVVLAMHGAQFPALCPNCGSPAQRTLRVTRAGRLIVFNDDGPNETVHEIETMDVPFCERCIAAHTASGRGSDPSLIWRRLFGGTGIGEALGALIVGGVAFFFLKEAVLKMSLVLLCFAAIPGSVAFFLLRGNWRRNEYMSVLPASTVTSAVEFTPILSLEYEPAWRAFRFRNAGYVTEFRTLNADKLWNPQGQPAQQARALRQKSRKRTYWIVGIVVAAILLWGLWQDYGKDLLDLIDRLR